MYLVVGKPVYLHSLIIASSSSNLQPHQSSNVRLYDEPGLVKNLRKRLFRWSGTHKKEWKGERGIEGETTGEGPGGGGGHLVFILPVLINIIASSHIRSRSFGRPHNWNTENGQRTLCGTIERQWSGKDQVYIHSTSIAPNQVSWFWYGQMAQMR